jgi:predicted phage tail component-like protein
MNINQGMKVTFNGIDLSKWIEVSDVQRNIGQNRKATLIKIGTSNGKRFISTSADEGTIVVKGDVMYQLVSQRRDLAAALATDEPVQLIFDDEPDKYYMAICDQQTTMSEDQFLGEAVITFIVPDDLAHSVDPKNVQGTSDTDVVVDNMGSAPTAPIISATMHGDNGLVAFVNDQGGVLQFGDPEEIDGVTKTRAEQVLRVGFDSDPGGIANNASGATNYPNYQCVNGEVNKRIGSMQFVRDSFGGTSMQPIFDNAGQNYWGGPSRELPIKANSAGVNTGNCWTVVRVQFDTSSKARGRLEYTLCNGNDVVMSIILRDSASAGDQMAMECWNQNTLLTTINLDRKVFKNGRYFQLKLYRFSARIGFQIAPVTSVNSTTDSATLGKTVLKEYQITNHVPITSASIWFERWQQTQHTIMGVSDLLFSWTDVEYWDDLANRFSDGDVVTADVANKAILVNGVEDMTLHTVGNTWDKFMLQPGENTIQTIGSSWCTTPLEVSVQYREAYY